jgi:uncharacterized Ntn-hydrolase superfamily protein
MSSPIKHLCYFAVFLILPSNAYATWSIIAVDRKTGETGVAGASCTSDVTGIASVVPGKGAIVVQAASNYFARVQGAGLIDKGAPPKEILAAIRDKQFDPEDQQYGVVTLYDDSAPLVYSGANISNWRGARLGADVATLGNTLVGQAVVDDAFQAFDTNRDKSLAERLVLALNAGAKAGGDNRCGTQHARSAFVMVYQPRSDSNLTLAVTGIKLGGKPAVVLLNEQFERWKPERKSP